MIEKMTSTKMLITIIIDNDDDDDDDDDDDKNYYQYDNSSMMCGCDNKGDGANNRHLKQQTFSSTTATGRPIRNWG